MENDRSIPIPVLEAAREAVIRTHSETHCVESLQSFIGMGNRGQRNAVTALYLSGRNQAVNTLSCVSSCPLLSCWCFLLCELKQMPDARLQRAWMRQLIDITFQSRLEKSGKWLQRTNAEYLFLLPIIFHSYLTKGKLVCLITK